jgi:hypothetical protein
MVHIMYTNISFHKSSSKITGGAEAAGAKLAGWDPADGRDRRTRWEMSDRLWYAGYIMVYLSSYILMVDIERILTYINYNHIISYRSTILYVYLCLRSGQATKLGRF